MKRRYLAALLTALLAAVAWPANGSLTPLIFGAFIPMLWLENDIRTSDTKKKGRKVFFYAWMSFALFNLFTTWWVAFAHWSGTLGTVLINGLLMAICFWLYHQVAKGIGQGRALVVFPFLWLLQEYLHMDWDMSFPWLNMGYALANRPTWIQWYSYLGTWGGSIWILWINAILYYGWKSYEGSERYKAWALFAGPVILIPLAISAWMYHNYKEDGKAINVVVVQPNIEPYVEKYQMSNEQMVAKFLNLARPLVADSTDYLVGPETMISRRGLEEGHLHRNRSIIDLQNFNSQFPRLHTVIGASTMKWYGQIAGSETARQTTRGQYYDAFNTGLQITSDQEPIDIYHKSKLVVGVEKIPFVGVLGPIMKGIDLGGYVGTLGGQDERSVFVNTLDDSMKVAPVICWEAEFPGYTAEFVRNGANAIFAITNDGWWRNTSGKDQHLHYARVRAIENRRPVVRSANTGISCTINQRGDIAHFTPYGEDGAFAAKVITNTEITRFTFMGDFLGRIAVFISIIVLLSVFVKRFTQRGPAAR